MPDQPTPPRTCLPNVVANGRFYPMCLSWYAEVRNLAYDEPRLPCLVGEYAWRRHLVEDLYHTFRDEAARTVIPGDPDWQGIATRHHAQALADLQTALPYLERDGQTGEAYYVDETKIAATSSDRDSE